MRRSVVHVITKLDAGGAQETAVALCAGLRERGFDTLLVAGPDRGTGGDMWDVARARGVATHVVPRLHRAISPINDVVAVVALTRLLRRLRPDVVHTHSSKAGVVGRLAAYLARVPVIVHTVHGWSFRDYHRRTSRFLYVLLERIAARVTTNLVVVATTDRDLGLAHHIGDLHQYAVIRSGIDLKRFSLRFGKDDLRRRIAVEPDATVIGTVTRLGPPKDPWTTIAALPSLGDDIRLIVVGDGPFRLDLQARVEELGLHERVTFLGARSDVHSLLGAFDVFVLTSWSEGLPRSVIEAMASGLPIVVSAVGGMSELVGAEGLILVPPGDASAAAEAIGSALTDVPRPCDGPRRRELLLEFSEEAMIRATAELYCGALRRHRRRGGLGARHRIDR